MSIQDKLLKAAASGALTPSENFKAVTWTGTGSSQSITGVGFQPDFVWIKQRGGTTWHNLQDSTRGSTKHLYSNATNSEDTTADGVTSFDSDGFTLGGGNGFNGSGQSMVAWCWKANEGTTSSNTDGTITSTVQVNSDAGFSIVEYTGTGGSTQTVGHGLSQKPDFLIVKNRDSVTGWKVWHEGLTPGGAYVVELQDTTGEYSNASPFDSTEPGSSVFTVADFSYSDTNATGADYIAYAFHSVDGFSKFGSYTGNGSTNGPIVETGFEPAFLMIKRTDINGHHWNIWDNKRTPAGEKVLYANLTNAESSYGYIKFLSNGFQNTRTNAGVNANGGTYIYMAFAADPDTEAPTLASSFNIETYTGNGGTQDIETVGFRPSLVWIKERSSGKWHNLHDQVRGFGSSTLFSNSTAAANTTEQHLTRSLPYGFTVNSVDSGTSNGLNLPYVAWTWKADDNEPTIFGGPARAVYKFEDNSNDVTTNYNGTDTSMTYSSSGKFNKAAEFNGSSGFITLPTDTDDLYEGANKFSWSVWVNPDSFSTQNPIFTKYSSNIALGGLQIKIDGTTGKIGLFIANSSDSRVSGASDTAISTGTWSHIVAVFDGTKSISNGKNGRIRIFINGVESSFTYDNTAYTGTTIPAISSSVPIRLGIVTFGGGANTYHDGKIDQLRLYKGALDEYQVNELYNETAAQNDDLTLGGPPETIISANANAGFSIVKQTGNGGNAKIPHGLSSAPELIIRKNLTTGGSGSDWWVYCSEAGTHKYGYLNHTDAFASNNNAAYSFAQTAPTATVFSVGNDYSGNLNNEEIIAYCFHSVSGYSKFGTYTGTGSSQTITTGFKPDWILTKRTDTTDNWRMYDSIRQNTQPFDMPLYPNITEAESAITTFITNATSTGFTLGTGNGSNASGGTYIYWAIAKNVPSNTTLANSFKAVTYTGNGGTQSITGTGFKPDLVWIKHRNEANDHVLTDSIRGRGLLYANGIDAQNQDSQLTSFDSDGFSLAYNTGQNVKFNKSGGTYVAWAWKAGNTWQSNLDGTIPSTINVNTANGFSIVKWTGNATNSTVGHGLSSTPEFIIMKNTSAAGAWLTWHKDYGGGDKYMYLNSTNAVATQSQFFNSTIPTSTVFSLGIHGDINGNGNDIIAYCFHSVAGYSKIGSYSGGSTGSGNVITTGFQPDWIMIKRTDTADDWTIMDSVRGDGASSKRIIVNTSEVEKSAISIWFPTSTGFYFSGTGASYNSSGGTYIYMAIKMN